MEKLFLNKKIWKKLVIAILITISVQMLPNNSVYADPPGDVVAPVVNFVFEGVLVNPVVSLVMFVSDGVMQLLHENIMGQNQVLIKVQPYGSDDDIPFLLKLELALVNGPIGVAALQFGYLWDALVSLFNVENTGITNVVTNNGIRVSSIVYDVSKIPETVYLPIYTYTPEEIFMGNIGLFNINFFEDDQILYVEYNDGSSESLGDIEKSLKSSTNQEISESDIEAKIEENAEGKGGLKNYFYYRNGVEDDDNKVVTSKQDSAKLLRPTIARWYVAIRNICIVLMLSILIYIGIRMMLTSLAGEKAKYIEMIKDWLTGLCLLFVMHYIMAFSVTIVEKITEAMATTVNKNLYVVALQQPDGSEEFKKITDTLNLSDEALITADDGKSYLLYPTNLMGSLRIQQQMKDEDTGRWMGLTVMFILLVVLTCIFTFTYLRRLLYMAFLTLIAPLVALTYCIDKTNDGQAQGFNMWLKEYIFNLLIQPLHLLLYFVLVTSAFELAGKNIIYSIIALVFMVPAEKLLRKMFGFEKVHTPPSLMGAAAGTSIAMNALNRLKGVGPHGAEKSSREKKEEELSNSKIKTANNLGGNVNATQAIAASNPKTTNTQQTTQGQEKSRATTESQEGSDLPDGEATENPEQLQLFDNPEEQKTYWNSEDENSQQPRLADNLDNQETSQNMDETQQMPRVQDNLDMNQAQGGNASETRLTATGNNRASVKAKNSRRDKAKRLGRYLSPKVKRGAIKGAKTLAKTAIKAPLIGAGVVIGGAITAAGTGDVGKTVQAMAAGGATGAGFGTGITRLGESAAHGAVNVGRSTASFARGARDAWTGDDSRTKARQNEKQIKKMMENAELRNKISSQFGEERLEVMESSGDLRNYIANGVQNPDEIIALEQLRDDTEQNGGRRISSDAAIGTWQLHRSFADGKNTNNMKDREKVEKAIHGKYKRESAGGDDDRATDLTTITMRYMDNYSKHLFKDE